MDLCKCLSALKLLEEVSVALSDLCAKLTCPDSRKCVSCGGQRHVFLAWRAPVGVEPFTLAVLAPCSIQELPTRSSLQFVRGKNTAKPNLKMPSVVC